MAISEPDFGLATAYSLVMVVALLGNIATICNFKCNDWLRIHKCHVYILGLAVADLGTALVPLPVNALIAAQGLWPFSRQACMAYDYFRIVIENNGVLVTLLISVDRCRLLWLDFSSYIRGSTPRRVSLELGLTWLLPAVGHGVMAVVWIIIVPLDERDAETTPDCQDVPSDADIPFSALYAVLLIFTPGLFLAVLNTFTFIGVARKLKRRRQIADGVAFRGPPSSNLAPMKKQHSAFPRSDNDNPEVLSARMKESNIPSLSFNVVHDHQDGLSSTRCGRDARPTLDRTSEETAQPGPSAAVEKVAHSHNVVFHGALSI
ncbi:alpha-1D adrenergic receptor-like [Patiria miniata]|uniref:G-protein coupled receptors family 1 profile domain-containing protein n=1 Tax=Patiria miniata TaxID=46514 RepID=A0A914ASR9_PATMI|nr:alpha-1D adrenergic receptor-like [Patiria miniata]